LAARWQVIPARAGHINRIANRMRPHDVREVSALGKTPKRAMRNSFAASFMSWTVLMDGQPVAMFGASAHDLMEGVGGVWFLGTDDVSKGARPFMRWGPRFVEGMLREFPRLENYVSVENAPAIRLLKALGFAIDDEIVVLGGVPFRHFSKARSCV